MGTNKKTKSEDNYSINDMINLGYRVYSIENLYIPKTNFLKIIKLKKFPFLIFVKNKK